MSPFRPTAAASGPTLRRLWIASLFALAYCGTAAAQQPVTDNTDGDETVHSEPTDAYRSSVESLIQRVQQSIVTIQTKGRDGDQLGIGTGFVIDSSGLIATNLHVISEGRRFEVKRQDETPLKVIAIEASDRADDLALIRVDAREESLPALPLAATDNLKQGREVIAIGNPFGLRNSVVRGVVSAVRQVDGRQLIQLAIPIQPGNSGGPLIDLDGHVHGILNMKSAVDDNLGFAIPIARLVELRADPNPVQIDRWVRLGRLDASRWETLFGGTWQQRAGMISVSGTGQGFGGRALCLLKQATPDVPFDVAVEVRLDDESGAAGLVFHSDGENRHYGFYPSSGNLRLSCFRGPNVFSWQVLEEVASDHYRPGEWNRLRVRVEEEHIRCYVNGQLVIESTDPTFSSGRVGLARFRDTAADFRRFAVAADLAAPELNETNRAWLDRITQEAGQLDAVTTEELSAAAPHSQAVARQLEQQAFELTRRATSMRRLADDVRLTPVLQQLGQLLDSEEPEDLVRGALWIAALDNPRLDVDAYLQRLAAMAEEVRDGLAEPASPHSRLKALDEYLFQKNGFHGGRDEYYHPANSHLNRVIDDREGMPITLSILYIDLARRLGVKVDGIGLPGHFVVRRPAAASVKAPANVNVSAEAEAAATTESNEEPTESATPDTDAPGSKAGEPVDNEPVDNEPGESEPSSELVDVFDRAKPLRPQDAASLTLQFAGRLIEASDLQPQTVEDILIRVLRNLIGSAQRENDLEALVRYTEGLVALRPDDPHFRMMRVIIFHQTDRDQRALEDLEWLIKEQPAEMERQKLIRMRDFLLQ